MAKRRADVSIATDHEVLAARFVLLEDALVTLSEENTAMKAAIVALGEQNIDLRGAVAALDVGASVMAEFLDDDLAQIEDLTGRLDELEGTAHPVEPAFAIETSCGPVMGPLVVRFVE